MKSLRTFFIATAVAGCGGPSSSHSNFTGAPSSVNLTTTVDCGGQTTSDTESETVSFTSSGDDIGYVSKAGCSFQFSLSGETAALTNAPVTCSTVAGGQLHRHLRPWAPPHHRRLRHRQRQQPLRSHANGPNAAPPAHHPPQRVLG